MISCNNIQTFNDVDFADYLKFPGYSQSFLKREINGLAPSVEVTNNMKLGSMVDAILTEPHRVDINSPFFDPAKIVALELKKNFGQFIDQFKKQVNYTGMLEYNGFKMPVRGRLDFLLPKISVTDLKYTTSKLKNIPELIKFMGYDNQLWLYCKLSGVKKAYIMAYSEPDKRSQLFSIPVDNPVNNFWANKIEKFGDLI